MTTTHLKTVHYVWSIHQPLYAHVRLLQILYSFTYILYNLLSFPTLQGFPQHMNLAVSNNPPRHTHRLHPNLPAGTDASSQLQERDAVISRLRSHNKMLTQVMVIKYISYKQKPSHPLL